MALKDRFKDIGANGVEFRGVPFWAWNDELDREELARQVQQMATAGLGGHFMHAREGLITPYMGSEWMECIKATLAASKNAGIRAWLYDEDRWPSGAAGGAVPALGEEYVAKQLRWEIVTPLAFKPQNRTIATFIVCSTDDNTLEVKQIEPKLAMRKTKPGPEQLLHFYYDVANWGLPWPYADLLNPKAVREFIRHTYDGYHKAVGREFGKTIPGIFTDEPAWLNIPWSTELPRFFKSLTGYELVPALPMLVYATGNHRAFRYDFWYAATKLFVQSFTKQIGDWCAKHKIAFTGHFMAEDNLRSQMHYIGAAMPHYEHMQIPGIDHLHRQITDPLLPKQVSSVAHQFGGRRVLSETFGGSGWNVSFEELKWIAEWQFAQGVDLVCQHLSLYSARGCRKRDWPPSLHYQQPWWGDYKLLNDYFARLTFMLTRGKHVADVLLLHNIESAWAAYDAENTSEVDALSEKLVSISKALLESHYDFDFGDEGILAKHARVAGRKLHVKSCEYQAVIVPPCVTIRNTTIRLLGRLIKNGGTVFLVGAPPKLMNGRPSDEPARVLRGAIDCGLQIADCGMKNPKSQDLIAKLAKFLTPRIQVLGHENKDAASIYVQQRDAKPEQIYFLANTSREEQVAATVRFPPGLSGRLERWDPQTGDTTPLATRKRGNSIETTLDFQPMGSHLLVLHKGRKAPAVHVRKKKTLADINLADSWSLERTEPNALTLDYCSYRVGDGEWSKTPMPVLTVQDNLKHIAEAKICEFKYSFVADFSARRPQNVPLVIEEPEAYEISMNGLPVDNPEPGAANNPGWWRDISFRKLNVSHLVKPQDTNEIVLRRPIAGEAESKHLANLPNTTATEKNRFLYGPEIESIYIIGEFTVRSTTPFIPLARRALRTGGGFTLADSWGQATTGDLVQQGLPFYAGTVRLVQSISIPDRLLKAANGAKLSLEPPDAITTRLNVNGKPTPARAWRPYEFEIGELLVPGRNEIAIELTGSLRNLLGPHHHAQGELYVTAPCDFRAISGSAEWTDSYAFVCFGLRNSPGTLTIWK